MIMAAFPPINKYLVISNQFLIVSITLKLDILILAFSFSVTSQRTITCSKFTIETLEQGVKYVQS